ncbi:spore germination protein [Bacillus gaemokensis]|nr:spore germination protein [Bacillus gaemokensis]
MPVQPFFIDLVIRMPLQMMKRRPKMLNPKDSIRKGSEE